MGGQAFAKSDPPIPTPRMPPEVYAQVLTQTHAVLRTYFGHVDSAVEAPGKETYGDVDILVYGPFNPTWADLEKGSTTVAETLAKALGAKKYLSQKGNPTVNFAIPWPGQDIEDMTKEDKCIQLDVHTCFSLVSFKWELFHAAHGDLWNIIGSTIRPFGLTVNDQGMYLRIPEIELYDRKKSMIFLTANPSEVLEFLGLEEERWWRQFRSKEHMFEYATGCRMFRVKEADDPNEAEEDMTGEAAAAITHNIDGQEGGEKGKKKLKHNDRQRMAKRPIFKEWIDEFIPRCRERGNFRKPRASREQIQQEAITRFGVQEKFETRLKEWNLVKHQDHLWRVVIKGSIPLDGIDPALRAAATRTLKSTIMEGVEFEGVIPKAATKDEDGFYDIDEVRRFVMGNWEAAGRIGLARQDAKAREAMKVKAEKREKEESDARERKRKEVPA
ncbi:hypothetical protein OIDMADRAFT_196300 [Oidiodendron maius Zn]|uniref:Uncharacterized protein n=1 Tax=Oidiodendron maius (strain Zn) TaxID=913774 RepID=A0A0C3DID4_OIDMZ|nr:hypothetical protein OIDMADRAFT_196300 [Oidiodendron maius Zn]